ncbi:hypothetical protein J4405_00390 [Candidatus Woesearchaeota archaeon]|nr:hypothetical protein [Candidatus Woesearchaeota archaeon]
MDKDKTRFILYQDLVYLSAMIITDFLKITEKYNLTEYNFIQGHLADIGLSGVFTGILYNHIKNKRNRFIPLVVPPILLTSWEIIEGFIPGQGTDPIDIACYFTGSITAYTGIEYFSTKEKRKKIKEQLKNIFRHRTQSLDKSLE